MRVDKGRLVFAGIRGRNGGQSPLRIAENECVEALNVNFDNSGLCQKRYGGLAITMTNGPAVACCAAVKHIPSGGTETTAELFANDINGAITRFSPGPYTWSTPTIADAGSAITTTYLEDPHMSGATLNGKCFLAYNSAVNRLHCWDGTSIRRVGLAPFGAAATVGNTGSGSYAATLRYYKVASAHISGTTHVRRSELSASVSFTPSGSGTHARVTRPTAVGEGETHWLVYASADDVYSNYHLIATVAIGTTTYDDNGVVASYTGDAPQIAGLNIPPPSVKYIITDGNRLLMAGAYETSAAAGQTDVKHARVWFTRVLGSSGIGDDESIPNTAAVGVIPAQKNWIDVGENDGGGKITALAIINGVVFAFKRQFVYRLAPTGDDLSPYRAVLVSDAVGCFYSQSVAAGESTDGNPALYFTNVRGVYRMSLEGAIDCISRPVDDRFLPNGLAACVYHTQRAQLWVTVGDGSAMMIYHVKHDGWTTYSFSARCAVMFPQLSNSGGNLTQTGTETAKPFLFSGAGAGSTCVMADDENLTADAGVSFQATITSRPVFPAGLGVRAMLHDAVLAAKVATGVTITATIDGDFGATGSTKTAIALLTAAASETRLVKRMEESALSEIDAVQITLGDSAAAANYWALDGLSVVTKALEPRA